MSGSWDLPDGVLDALAARLAVLRPIVSVEAGSGRSTAVLAEWSQQLVSLEHGEQFAADTWAGVPAHLRQRVDLLRVDLVPFETPAGTFPWYDAGLSGTIDFALIDGPPGAAVGRQAAGFALLPHLNADGEAWLDDAGRAHEQACLALWQRHLPITVEPHPTLPRIAIIRRTGDQ